MSGFRTVWKALDAQGRDWISVTKSTPKLYEIDLSTAGKWQIAVESADVGTKRTVSVIFDACSDSGNVIQQDAKFRIETPNSITAVDFDVALWQTPFKLKIKVKTSYDKSALKFRALVRQQSASHADVDEREVNKVTATAHTKKSSSSGGGDSSSSSSHGKKSSHKNSMGSSTDSHTHSHSRSKQGHSQSESKKDSGDDIFSLLDPLGPSSSSASSSTSSSTSSASSKMANGNFHTSAPTFPGLMGGGGSSTAPSTSRPQQFNGLLGQTTPISNISNEPPKRGDIMALFSQPGAKADPFANLKI